MNRLNTLAVTKITGIYTPTYYEEEIINMKNRMWYGVSLAIDGEITYYHKGKTYHSNKNTVIFLPKGATYNLNCYKPGKFTLVNFLGDENFTLDDFLEIPISDPEGFLHIFKLMENLFLFEGPGKNFELMSLFYSMLSKLYANKEKQCSYPIIKAGTEYMEKNINNPELSNEGIARSAGVSEIYFRKLFKKQFGVTPHAYIQQIRINKAKSMLENGISQIDDVCLECGYSNIYYFFKVFKEKTGYTPTEYREKYFRRNL